MKVIVECRKKLIVNTIVKKTNAWKRQKFESGYCDSPIHKCVFVDNAKLLIKVRKKQKRRKWQNKRSKASKSVPGNADELKNRKLVTPIVITTSVKIRSTFPSLIRVTKAGCCPKSGSSYTSK